MSVQVQGTILLDDSKNLVNVQNLLVSGTINVAGTTGTAGQYLTSNGSSNVYWSAPAAGVKFYAFGSI